MSLRVTSRAIGPRESGSSTDVNTAERRQRGKRALDLALVTLTSLAWAPLLAAAAAAVYFESSKPVFFKQVRMGRGQRPFTIIKLRTMNSRLAAPSGSLFQGWTYSGDPRVTRVGRWLRRYRLDELPQVFNVLRGEMSLVGPRPEPWDVAVALGEQIPGYHLRHAVLPGITGVCQIDPSYLEFGTIEQSAIKARLDFAYVIEWSLGLDVRVLLQTPLVVLRGMGVA